jgi:predicted RNA binding protein YcfA (HicA-like mRNA interferase family)
MISNPYKIEKLLLKNGWERRKGQTSHAVFSHPEIDRIISIPVHKGKALSKGHLSTIQKLSGVKLL